MKQVGVRKMYAYTSDQVVDQPEILIPNAGVTCTDELVDEAIEALHSLGYGLGAGPSELSCQHVSVSTV